MSAVLQSTKHGPGWKLIPLQELGTWTGGGTPSKSKPEFWSNGTIPWVSPKDMKTNRINESQDRITQAAIEGSAAKLIPAQSVLLVTRSGILSHTLPVAVTSLPVAVNQDLKAITPNEAVLPDYLAWALRCFARDILNTCSKQGTTVSSIETKALQEYEVPVAPLDKQREIVAEIEKQFSRLDEAVTNLYRVKANLKRYKAAVLKAAVEGRLVETEAELARREGRTYETGEQLLQRTLETRRNHWKGKGKYTVPPMPSASDLPELPEGWVWATVGSVGAVIGGLTKNRKRTMLPLQLPYLRVANVYADELRLQEIEEIGVEERELEKLLLQKGDLLVVEGNGSPEQIGRLAMWDGSINPCVHQNHLIKIRMRAECDPRWALCWLMAPEGRTRIKTMASSTSGLYTLSVGKVSSLLMPLPPVKEQHRIIAEVATRNSTIQKFDTDLRADLVLIERLRHTVITANFRARRTR